MKKSASYQETEGTDDLPADEPPAAGSAAKHQLQVRVQPLATCRPTQRARHYTLVSTQVTTRVSTYM